MRMTADSLRLRRASSSVFGLAFVVLCLSLFAMWLVTREATLLRMSIMGTLLFACLLIYRVQYLGRAFARQGDEPPAADPAERARAERQFWLIVTVALLLLLVPSVLTWPLGGSLIPTVFGAVCAAGLVVALVLRRRAIRLEVAAAQAGPRPSTDKTAPDPPSPDSPATDETATDETATDETAESP